MFERYTERARRVLFFARYEATQMGSTSIETEHLLLGLIREGKGLTSRIFARSHLSLDGIRKEVEGRTVFREKVATSQDIPFSTDTKRVLQFAAEEADRLLHTYIGTEHLLLGILREERTVAAAILYEKGMRLASVREDIVQLLNEKTAPARPKETPLLAEFSRDLTEAPVKNQLDPLVGRDLELERVQQVLCRRTKNNAVLIGEPGVGKTGHRRRPRAEDRLRRRAALPRRQARARAGHLADRRRHQVSRPVRRAPQSDHEGAHREPEHHRVHR
jgi:ATP-dependent Clp protease ATP-binding subunit ClpC